MDEVEEARSRVLKAVCFLVALGIIPMLFTIGTLREHYRRLHVLNEGASVSATVTSSNDKGYRNLCLVEYQFQGSTTLHTGSIISCPMMDQHPVGSAIAVRYDPSAPDDSLAVGEVSWPPMTAAAVLLMSAWLFFVALIGFALLQRKRRGHPQDGEA